MCAWGVGSLIRKDPDKGDSIDNFKLIPLLNTEVKLSAKVFAKRLVRIVNGLIREAQTCVVPGRSILEISTSYATP